MNDIPRIYLDNAATTWPKPESVYEAVDDYQRHLGAPSGRSGYKEAMQSNRILEQTRLRISRLINTDSPTNIVFAASGTDSLNMAIHGTLRPGDHVVTTVCEHNSVLRPLRAWREDSGVEVTYVPCDGQGIVSPDDIRDAMRPNTRLVAVIHASNVTGALQPIEEIGAIVRDHSAFFLVDAAQSLGHVRIDVEKMHLDLLAAPGHKGLLGPLGTSLLFLRPGIEDEVRPYRLGGTGTQSDEDKQPSELPDKYEPGNHNLVGVAGLAASLDWIEKRGLEALRTHEQQLTKQLMDGLEQIPKLSISGPSADGPRVGVVSLNVEGYDPQDTAAILDASAGVQCRAGLHCAPKMHASLGTDRLGGLVRLSLGWATTAEEIAHAVEALAQLPTS